MKKLYISMVIVAVIFIIFNLMGCTEKTVTMPQKQGIKITPTPDRPLQDDYKVRKDINL